MFSTIPIALHLKITLKFKIIFSLLKSVSIRFEVLPRHEGRINAHNISDIEIIGLLY